MHQFNDIYPFSAIVGQEQMKKALLLNAINPRIGGVLIKGEKGTAKSGNRKIPRCPGARPAPAGPAGGRGLYLRLRPRGH